MESTRTAPTPGAARFLPAAPRDVFVSPFRDRVEDLAKPKAHPRPRPIPVLRGSFVPPQGTVELDVGRQPDGFTCGTETFLGITELLRLPLRDPDIGLWKYRRELHTSFKDGTEPEDIARAARDHLGIGARVRNKMSIAQLASITNETQRYIDALDRGVEPSKPLTLAMVTYQAYVDPARQFSKFKEHGHERRLPVRGPEGQVLWTNNYSDGHWSAITRVVQPNEGAVLRKICRDSNGRLSFDAVRRGVVVLADPSNGEGHSFIPTPEFEERWHDSNRANEAVYQHTAIVFTVSVDMLRKMKAAAEKQGVPMFATTVRNSVVYVP